MLKGSNKFLGLDGKAHNFASKSKWKGLAMAQPPRQPPGQRIRIEENFYEIDDNVSDR